jgi:hypothetical protein
MLSLIELVGCIKESVASPFMDSSSISVALPGHLDMLQQLQMPPLADPETFCKALQDPGAPRLFY